MLIERINGYRPLCGKHFKLSARLTYSIKTVFDLSAGETRKIAKSYTKTVSTKFVSFDTNTVTGSKREND